MGVLGDGGVLTSSSRFAHMSTSELRLRSPCSPRGDAGLKTPSVSLAEALTRCSTNPRPCRRESDGVRSFSLGGFRNAIDIAFVGGMICCAGRMEPGGSGRARNDGAWMAWGDDLGVVEAVAREGVVLVAARCGVPGEGNGRDTALERNWFADGVVGTEGLFGVKGRTGGGDFESVRSGVVGLVARGDGDLVGLEADGVPAREPLRLAARSASSGV